MLILIHLQIEERCKSQEPYGSRLQRRKRCVKFLTPLAPNKIKFTSKAGHSFGASKMRAGTCSQLSMGIPVSCRALQEWIRATGHCKPSLQKADLDARWTWFNKLLNLCISCLKCSWAAWAVCVMGCLSPFSLGISFWGQESGVRRENELQPEGRSLELVLLRFKAMD